MREFKTRFDMPLFKVSENLYINTEHVADIEYVRGGVDELAKTLTLPRVQRGGVEETPTPEVAEPGSLPKRQSSLRIDLLGKDGKRFC